MVRAATFLLLPMAVFFPSVAAAQPTPPPQTAPPDPGKVETPAPAEADAEQAEDTADEPAPAGEAEPAEAPAPPAERPPPTKSRPPPHYYVEPADPKQRTTEGPPPPYEPPPPGPVVVYEPPPPVPVQHRSPKTAFWAGARLGWFVPFGTLWYDGFAVGGLCCNYRRRTWSDYASPGPMFEIDAGVRLGRYYNVFALWEHASLGSGGLDEDSFGGQNRGDTDRFGVGLRFSTNPDDIGFLIELALGYRRFGASWEDGTQLDLADGLFDARIGVGADIRLGRLLSLSPLVTIGSGVFTDAEWNGRTGSRNARGPLDENGQYGTLTFELGAHFDVY